RRLLEGKAGALGVALAVATSPILLWCDRDIRGYALLVPLALATVLFWLRAREKDGTRDWAGFVFFAWLATYDHYNAIPLVAGLTGLAFLEKRSWRPVVAGVVILALYVPWLPALREQLTTMKLESHGAKVQ